jgi:transposase
LLLIGELRMIKKLKRQGLSILQIARQVGACRNTIKKYLALPDGVVPKQTRSSRPSIADEFMGLAYELIVAGKKSGDEIPASAIYEEIKRQGYKGSLRTLQRTIASWELRVDKTRKPDPVVRFETEPGIQMQVDWIEFPKDKLSAFVATLGYSRMSYVEYVSDERVETLIECHKNAFAFFGGITRECLYDNVKTVIQQRNRYGKGRHKYHPMFEDFAKHYGFSIRMCQPYRAKTKGKVERFNKYLRHSFHKPLKAKLLIKGADLNLISANAEVMKWLIGIANIRNHQTTLEKPIVLFEATEKNKLIKLPFIDYEVNSVRIHEELASSEPIIKPKVLISKSTKRKGGRPNISPLSHYDRLIPSSGVLL